MKSVIIAQLKQIGRSKLKYIAFAVVLAVGIINAVNFYLSRDDGTLTEASACEFILYNEYAFFSFIHVFIGISVADICAGDFSDKTFYYEVMGGQTRFSSYFGRAVVSLVFTLIGSVIIVTVPVILCTALCGWGTLFTVGDVLRRLIVSVVPIIRIICVYICFAFILRQYSVMNFMGGFIVSMLCGEGLFDKAPSTVLGTVSVFRLCTFEAWQNYSLRGGFTPVVDASLASDEIVSIVAWSLIASALTLIVGYVYFRYDDLN